MTAEILYVSSFAFSLAAIVVTAWTESAVETHMKSGDPAGPPASNSNLITTDPSSTAIALANKSALRPVELGYMLRGGDTNHALLVMGVDLLQRAAKLQLGAAIPEPSEYEKKMWAMAKDAAKDWAMKKVETHLPGDLKKNPAAFVKKIYDIYTFCTKSLKLVVKDIIDDPRQLKRYFSAGGVMRLLADFISAGYQSAFNNALRTYLVENNYLVKEEARTKAAKKLALASFSTFAAVFLFSLAMVGTANGIPLMFVAATIVTGSAIVSAFFITAIFAVRELLPYLTEFEHLAKVLNRDSWRLRVLQTARKAMFVALSLLALGASTLLFTCGFLWLKIFAFKNPQALIFVSVILAFPCLKAFLLLLRSWKLTRTEVATKYGEAELEKSRIRLSQMRPVTALRQVLKEEDYDPVFSELMALYGIEALILLA